MSSQRPVPFPSYERYLALCGFPHPRSRYEVHRHLADEHAVYRACQRCQQPFADANTRTAAGWAEIQISGLCEDCFDQVCSEEELADAIDRSDREDPDLDPMREEE